MKPIISCLQVSDLYNFSPFRYPIFIKCINPYIVMFILHKSAYPLFCTEYHIAVIQLFQCMSPKDNVTRRADRNTGQMYFLRSSITSASVIDSSSRSIAVWTRCSLSSRILWIFFPTGQSGFGFS